MKNNHEKIIKKQKARIKELDNSLSIALEINDNYQRENKDLKSKIKESREINKLHRELNIRLKDQIRITEGKTSPEMKALQKEVEKLKADLALAKEDHQYDNLVHQKELKDFRKGRWDPNFKPLDGSEK